MEEVDLLSFLIYTRFRLKPAKNLKDFFMAFSEMLNTYTYYESFICRIRLRSNNGRIKSHVE